MHAQYKLYWGEVGSDDGQVRRREGRSRLGLLLLSLLASVHQVFATNPRFLPAIQLLCKQNSFHLSNFYFGKNSFIDPAANWPRILESIHLLVYTELSCQSSFYLNKSKNLFINPDST